MAALKSARFLMSSLWVCTWAASAQAENLCEENQDCPTGYMCETLQGVTPPCAATPCKMGEECEPSPPECTQQPVEYKQCVPVSCETDADCGQGAVCFSQSRVQCSGSGATDVACAPNQMCPKPEPAPEPNCTEYTIKQCVARYVLPCEQDNDCGEGFSCQAGEECMCAGSAGGASAKPAPALDGATAYFAPVPPKEDAGVAKGDAAAPTCECHPTELKHCELKQMTCSVDADCPSDFVCVTAAEDAVACAAPRDAADASVAACDPAPSKPAAKRCEPRFFAGQGPTRDGSDKGSGAPNYGEGGSVSAPHDSSAADAGITPDVPNTEGTGTPAEDTSACSVSTPRAGSLHALLAPFGLALLALGLRSRRKQR